MTARTQSLAAMAAQIGAELVQLGRNIAAGLGLVWLAGAVLIDWPTINPNAAQLVTIITAAGLTFGVVLAGGHVVSKSKRREG